MSDSARLNSLLQQSTSQDILVNAMRLWAVFNHFIRQMYNIYYDKQDDFCLDINHKI